MKKIFFVIAILFCVTSSSAQGGLFSKERLENLQNFDKRFLTYGYFLGFNSYDFKFDYKQHLGNDTDVLVQRSAGFNVGLVGDMKITENIHLRLEPGLYFTQRDLEFRNITGAQDSLREVKSTYIHVPLLVKFSTNKLNNFRPFVVGGVSASLNLSSNQDNPEDNEQGKFRMMKGTYYYELGFGIDFYLYYFKFTPSIRGVFALNDELVRDDDPNSPWTGNIDKLSSRAIFINFTFQ
ncbi:porin family protein [Aequorivita sediminis]|uniref:type IX secretion/gliding motility protein PorT/SprT n=1 Tax=Aequorivita sediminis TaxID=3073653 RepID=UPI0028AD5BA4|nr:porin family protein [Aequorivita sp. F6058]